jgi:hypothetical protein
MSIIFRATDIETLDDPEAWTRGDPTYKLVAMPAPSACVPEGNHLAYGAGAMASDQIPPPYACRVVSISYVDVCFDPARTPKCWFDRCFTDCRWDVDGCRERADMLEYGLLKSFGDDMAAAGTSVNLVTWNGRGFDLPVIMMRSLRHRLACGWYYANRDMRYRFSPEGHCDLMDFLSDYGAARFMKLGDVARSIGLPGKTDMSGDKVSVLYAQACADRSMSEELQAKTARYCLQDSIQTAILWLRTRHLLGKFDADTHNAVLATFRESVTVTAAIDIDWDRLML